MSIFLSTDSVSLAMHHGLQVQRQRASWMSFWRSCEKWSCGACYSRKLANLEPARTGPWSEIFSDRRVKIGSPRDKGCKRASISQEMLKDMAFQPEVVWDCSFLLNQGCLALWWDGGEQGDNKTLPAGWIALSCIDFPSIVSDDAVDRVSINEQTLSARLRVGAWEDEKSMAQELGLALRHFQQYNTTLQRQWPVAWLERTRQASSTDDGMGLVNGAEEELLEQVEGQEMEKNAISCRAKGYLKDQTRIASYQYADMYTYIYMYVYVYMPFQFAEKV